MSETENEPAYLRTRRELCMYGSGVTLNGQPAAIVGWADDVATIFQIGSSVSITCNWVEAERIMKYVSGQFAGVVTGTMDKDYVALTRLTANRVM